MALVSNLGIYKAVYELTLEISNTFVKIPKLYRYTLGQKLLDTCLELFPLLVSANAAGDPKDRLSFLKELQAKFTIIETYLKFLNDLHCITYDKMSLIALKTESIGKQLTGWKHSTEGRL